MCSFGEKSLFFNKENNAARHQNLSGKHVGFHLETWVKLLPTLFFGNKSIWLMILLHWFPLLIQMPNCLVKYFSSFLDTRCCDVQHFMHVFYILYIGPNAFFFYFNIKEIRQSINHQHQAYLFWKIRFLWRFIQHLYIGLILDDKVVLTFGIYKLSEKDWITEEGSAFPDGFNS